MSAFLWWLPWFANAHLNSGLKQTTNCKLECEVICGSVQCEDDFTTTPPNWKKKKAIKKKALVGDLVELFGLSLVLMVPPPRENMCYMCDWILWNQTRTGVGVGGIYQVPTRSNRAVERRSRGVWSQLNATCHDWFKDQRLLQNYQWADTVDATVLRPFLGVLVMGAPKTERWWIPCL